MTYLRYTPDLEEISQDERETFEKIAETFADMGRKVADQESHAVRVSHAKATGLLTGELVVEAGLPPELAQGIAAVPGRFQTLCRFAQGPGEVLHDRISTHRGMAVKIIGVDGQPITATSEPSTQDFVLEGTGKAFINSNAEAFLANLKAGVSNAPSMPEGVKNAVSKVARATEAGLEAIGLESKTLAFFGHPPMHPMAESYFSQVPMRWGEFVGKVAMVPTEKTLTSLAEKKIEERDHDAFREAMIAHFASMGAEFELRVQLATDLDNTPIEDATKEWPEDGNPYQTVAKLFIGTQSAWSPEREAYFAKLSFRPANSLIAHCPLGQVMRARLFVYERMVAFRQHHNGETAVSPSTCGLPTFP